MNLTAMLLVLFIVLKLTGLIAWSWVWVLSPLWVPWCIIGVLCMLCGKIKIKINKE